MATTSTSNAEAALACARQQCEAARLNAAHNARVCDVFGIVNNQTTARLELKNLAMNALRQSLAHAKYDIERVRLEQNELAERRLTATRDERELRSRGIFLARM